jgi:ATP-dependent Lhr-like helicase
MGIDIGSVYMVGQIGAPWSVTSFKQRLGRSGRKDGDPRRLRGYVVLETPRGEDPLARIPVELLQTVAICELMLQKWVEPPVPAKLDLSTLTHQVISTIAETGAIAPSDLYNRLCKTGPFRGFSASLFGQVLRELAGKDVIEQEPRGKLILGLEGERLRSRKDFYAAFASRMEFSIATADRVLGTLPIETVPKPGEHIVFAARRWQVIDVDAERLVVNVRPAARRQRPRFLGGAGDVHVRVREEMRLLLGSAVSPIYLDQPALGALQEARAVAIERSLAQRRLIELSKTRCLWVTWTGSAAQRAILASLGAIGIEGIDREIAIECPVPASEIRGKVGDLERLLRDPKGIAAAMSPKRFRKYDYLLSDGLLNDAIAADRVDGENARVVIAELG